jgi:hypothetical protein
VSGNQAAGSIAINASGASVAATQVGFYAAPIRNDDTQTAALCYNTTTKEVTYATTGTKTFVINHPADVARYLVHACLEGPEAGVYYRGRGEVGADSVGWEARLRLPAYAAAVASDFTVQVTAIGPGGRVYSASEVSTDGSFSVYGPPGAFFWQAVGRRVAITVEPLKEAVAVAGDGPYKYIV